MERERRDGGAVGGGTVVSLKGEDDAEGGRVRVDVMMAPFDFWKTGCFRYARLWCGWMEAEVEVERR